MPSTAIRSFGYDPGSRTLTVTFITGRRYVYFDVPDTVAADFKAAFSRGAYFNGHIRDRYAYRELEPSGANRER